MKTVIIQSAFAVSCECRFNCVLPKFMNTHARKIRQLANLFSIAALTLAGTAPRAEAQSVWNAVAGTAANTNWTTAGNWSPSGVPGSATNVIFNDTTGVANATTINSVVNSGFGGTIASLTYTNFSTDQNTLIASGVTLNVTGSGGLGMGNATVLGTASSPVTTISGAGAKLAVNNASATLNVQIAEPSTSGTTILNMTNLDTFSFTGARVLVGVAGGARTTGVLYLARTNTITLTPGSTAPQLDVGDNSGNNGNGSTLYLGMTNVIFADSIAMGRSKQNSGGGGVIRFNPSFTNNNPVASFRGTNGVSPVGTWAIADGAATGGTVTDTGSSDFSGGTVNAVVTSMWLARNSTGANAGVSANNGTLTFSAGTITVGSLTNAMLASSAQTPTVNGNVNVKGTGLLTVTNVFVMAALNGFSGTANGSLNITNGTVQARTITAGGGTSTINMNGGTLVLTNTAGTLAAPLSAMNLTSAALQLPVANNTTNIYVSSLTVADNGSSINISALPVLYGYPTQFPLISYASFTGGGSINLGTLPGTYQGYVSNDTASVIWLVVTNGPSTAKADEWGGGVNNLWNTTTLNWTNAGVAVAYSENDSVTFDDLGLTNLVNLTTNHAPLGLLVTNNSLNYTFSGGGSITGSVGLNKQGNASLTLAETGGDNFSGGVVVGGGTLILDDTNCAIAGGVGITNGATLQIGNNDVNGALPAGGVDDEGTLVFSRANNILVATAITGGGGLTQNGNGTLTLTSTNGFTGGTIVGKGTLALTNSGSLAGSVSVLVSNATLDVSGLGGQTAAFNALRVTNATFNVAIAGVQPAISVVSGLTADGIMSVSNKINVVSLPNIASYPVTLTVIQSAGISLTAGNFNFALNSLPAGYAGSLTESGGNAIVLTLTSGPVGVRPSVIWSGADVPNLNTNWTDRLNWQLPGAPGSADNVVFNDTAALSSSALSSPGGGANALIPANFNNIVDTNFTISSLAFTNVGNDYHNTYINDGWTLTITNAATNSAGIFSVGGSATDFGGSAKGFVSIAGPKATVNVNNTNATVFVGFASASISSQQATLDMSALGTFNASVNAFEVGALSTTTVSPSGVAYLAQTNSITAVGGSANEGGQNELLSLLVGESGKNGTTECYLYLGQKNVINVNGVGIGIAKETAEMQFNPVFTSPTAVFRGGDGVSPIAIWAMGDGLAQTGASSTPSGTADFTGGTVDALVTTMYIGRTPNASGAHAGTGVLTFEAGIFNVGTLIAGYQAAAVSNNGVGTIYVNGTGILVVNNSLTLASAAGGAGAASTAGTLTIGGGTVQANTIVAGTNGASSTITLNSGTLILTNTAGTSAAPLSSLSLNGGTLQLMNVNGNGNSTNIVATSVGVGGTTTINIGSILNVIGGTATIPLITYVNGSDPGLGNLVLGSVPYGYTGGSLYDDTVNYSIDLIITAPPTLTWVGAVGSTLNSNWDAGTLDWQTNGTPLAYADPDYVVFDDTASNSTVKLTTTLSPSGVIVTNNVLNYVFSSSGKISGTGGLVKQGSATLTLDNSGGNNFSGPITIGGGTLQVGNHDANGALPSGNIADNGALVFSRTDIFTTANVISGSGTVAHTGSGTNLLSGMNTYSGTTLISGGMVVITNAGGPAGLNSSLGAIPGGAVTITNGGTLDVGGNTTANQLGFTNLATGTAKQFYIAGAGAGGNGAIVNNGPALQEDAFQYITLTANATIGGTNRWDMRGAGAVTPLLDLGGFTLTKTGINQDSMVSTRVTGGNIVINQGTISFETASSVTNGGSVTGTITVNSGGALGHYRTWSGAITRPITLNGGTITNLSTTGGGSTNDAPITLTANSTLADSIGSDLYLDGVISSSAAFGLTKSGTGRIVLTNADTYTGNTTISTGTLVLTGGGSIANTPTITVAVGATLDASTRSDSTLTLTAGQTLNGFGTVTGIVATASGSILAPGSSASLGILTLANSATLGGTNVMKLNKTIQTNDVLSVGGALALGGVLNVTNLSGNLTAADTFKLFSAAGGISGAFSAIVPATPGTGLGWNTNTLVTDGVLRLVATVNTNPTNLTATVSGNQLTLFWPADHTGWRLLVQTNNLAAGISLNTNDWTTVSGSTAINQTNITINPALPAEFYRLVYP